MPGELDNLFAELERRLDLLAGGYHDNEAMRHELVVRPVLTHPLILGWAGPELIEQEVISAVPLRELLEGSPTLLPKWRRPDVIILPYGLDKPVAVVEEKRRQRSMDALRGHSRQLSEYQYLHDVVWGLLTDGEKWILLKNDKEFHVFPNLSEMRTHLRDFQQCIGKTAVMQRLFAEDTQELIITTCMPHVHTVIAPRQSMPALGLQAFLRFPSKIGLDSVLHLSMQLSSKGHTLFHLRSDADADYRTFGDGLFMHALNSAAASMAVHAGILTMEDVDVDTVARLKEGYPGAVDRWIKVYAPLNDAHDRWMKAGQFVFEELVGLAAKMDAPIYRDYLSPECQAYLRGHPRYSQLCFVSGENLDDFLSELEEV